MVSRRHDVRVGKGTGEGVDVSHVDLAAVDVLGGDALELGQGAEPILGVVELVRA